jgi:hypothetical protein
MRVRSRIRRSSGCRFPGPRERGALAHVALDLAVAHAHDALRPFGDLVAVRDEHECLALGVQAIEEIENLDAGF